MICAVHVGGRGLVHALGHALGCAWHCRLHNHRACLLPLATPNPHAAAPDACTPRTQHARTPRTHTLHALPARTPRTHSPRAAVPDARTPPHAALAHSPHALFTRTPNPHAAVPDARVACQGQRGGLGRARPAAPARLRQGQAGACVCGRAGGCCGCGVGSVACRWLQCIGSRQRRHRPVHPALSSARVQMAVTHCATLSVCARAGARGHLHSERGPAGPGGGRQLLQLPQLHQRDRGPAHVHL